MRRWTCLKFPSENYREINKYERWTNSSSKRKSLAGMDIYFNELCLTLFLGDLKSSLQIWRMLKYCDKTFTFRKTCCIVWLKWSDKRSYWVSSLFWLSTGEYWLNVGWQNVSVNHQYSWFNELWNFIRSKSSQRKYFNFNEEFFHKGVSKNFHSLLRYRNFCNWT